MFDRILPTTSFSKCRALSLGVSHAPLPRFTETGRRKAVPPLLETGSGGPLQVLHFTSAKQEGAPL